MVEPTFDEMLMDGIRQGDKDSFSALFNKYFSTLLHYGVKLTKDEALTEECIQALFVYLFEHPKVLVNIKHPKTYLYTAFRHQLTATLKKRHSLEQKKNHFSTDLFIQFSPEDILIHTEERMEQHAIISQLLNELPARQREAIYLKYYGDLSTKEIAGVMRITSQGVLNMLYKAIKKLRNSSKLKDLKQLSVLYSIVPFCLF